MTAVIPWGASRMTDPLPEDPPLYDTIQLDPATQLTRFYDAGEIVDMGDKAKKVTVSMSKGGGSDGSSGSSKVADDSNVDG